MHFVDRRIKLMYVCTVNGNSRATGFKSFQPYSALSSFGKIEINAPINTIIMIRIIIIIIIIILKIPVRLCLLFNQSFFFFLSSLWFQYDCRYLHNMQSLYHHHLCTALPPVYPKPFFSFLEPCFSITVYTQSLHTVISVAYFAPC